MDALSPRPLEQRGGARRAGRAAPPHAVARRPVLDTQPPHPGQHQLGRLLGRPRLLYRGRGDRGRHEHRWRLVGRRARRLQRHAALEAVHRHVGLASQGLPLGAGAASQDPRRGGRPRIRPTWPQCPRVGAGRRDGRDRSHVRGHRQRRRGRRPRWRPARHRGRARRRACRHRADRTAEDALPEPEGHRRPARRDRRHAVALDRARGRPPDAPHPRRGGQPGLLPGRQGRGVPRPGQREGTVAVGRALAGQAEGRRGGEQEERPQAQGPREPEPRLVHGHAGRQRRGRAVGQRRTPDRAGGGHGEETVGVPVPRGLPLAIRRVCHRRAGVARLGLLGGARRAHRGGQEADQRPPPGPDRGPPSPLLPREGHRPLHHGEPSRHRVPRPRRRHPHAEQLDPRRLPVRDHALQRPHLRALTHLWVLHGGQALRLLGRRGGKEVAGSWFQVPGGETGDGACLWRSTGTRNQEPGTSRLADVPTRRAAERLDRGGGAGEALADLGREARWQAERPGCGGGAGRRGFRRCPSGDRSGRRRRQAPLDLPGRRAGGLPADAAPGPGALRQRRRVRLRPARERRCAGLALPRRPRRPTDRGVRPGRIGLARPRQRPRRVGGGLCRSRALDLSRRRHRPLRARPRDGEGRLRNPRPQRAPRHRRPREGQGDPAPEDRPEHRGLQEPHGTRPQRLLLHGRRHPHRRAGE